MNEMRLFQRIRFNAKCSLTHNNIRYLGQLENISANGALISFNDGVVIPMDESCSLTIYVEDEGTQLRLVVEVIHSNFTMIGIKFTLKDAEMQEHLNNLIERLTTGQDTLVSVHPETPDVTLLASNSETRDFSSWQGNREVARRRTTVRRTSKHDD